MAKPKRYPDNWQSIALLVKESALWRCTKCNQQCLPSGTKSGLTKSERLKVTLTVHHRNRIPEDNRLENLVALCTACHLSYHNRRESNVSPGQLSLFADDAMDWDISDRPGELVRDNSSHPNPLPSV
ncbi:HNH endonuclease [Microcoleus sp. A006_D1]|uniref:HNH endonuclease n=1 Tax=Microcoleus sp. A006_D1 TaxID=3055267 RepID=UPI002FCE8731